MRTQFIAALVASLYVDWLIAALLLIGASITVGAGLYHATAPVWREWQRKPRKEQI